MTVTWIRECSFNHVFLSKHQEAVSTKVYVIVRHLRYMRTMSNFWRTIVRPYAYFLTPETVRLTIIRARCLNGFTSLLFLEEFRTMVKHCSIPPTHSYGYLNSESRKFLSFAMKKNCGCINCVPPNVFLKVINTQTDVFYHYILG